LAHTTVIIQCFVIDILKVDMKTAISVDGHLLIEADRFAREMGLSRSRLFSLALEAYLRRQRQQKMTEQLNLAYA